MKNLDLTIAKFFVLAFLMFSLTFFLNAQTYVQVWGDEFNVPGLPDSTKWEYEIGQKRNNELQYYAHERLKNSRIEDTVLIIEAHKESFEGAAYTSASIISKGIGDWKYGKFEISAKVPTGKGTWPAIWMIPTYSEYGGWPKSGEIDIMEYIGVEPQNLFYNAHFEGDKGTGKDSFGSGGIKAISNPFNQFIKFELVWTPDKLEWYANNVKYHEYVKPADEYKVWPFDKQFYMILNLAYGGSWGGYNGVDDSKLPHKFLIDYVRVYQLREGDGPFSLNVNSAGFGKVEVDPVLETYPEGTEVTLTAVPDEGYVFDRWKHQSRANPYTFTINKNTDLTAIFENPLELLTNGTFSLTQTPWAFYNADDNAFKYNFYIENEAFVVDVTSSPLTDWKLGFQENGIALKKGKYLLSFDAYAEVEKELLITVSKNYGDWSSIVSTKQKISTENRTYTWEFEMKADDLNTRLYFGIGNFTGKFVIDNISLTATEIYSTLSQLKANKKTNQFLVSPNPSNGIFHLKPIDKLEKGKAEITVYSIDGKTIYKNLNSSAESTIDLSGAQKAIYVINIKTNSVNETHSVVLN